MMRRLIQPNTLAQYCWRSGRLCSTVVWRCGIRTDFGINTKIKYNDPCTWPKHWTEVEIERLLYRNLTLPAAAPNYHSLATLLRADDLKSLTIVLQAYVKDRPPLEVDLEQYLRRHLNNVVDSAAMALQERMKHLDVVVKALSEPHERQKHLVVSVSSPRGTGKTQFIKWFVSTSRVNAVKYGRVIVRCCDKGSHEGKSQSLWFDRVMKCATSCASTASMINTIDEGLCELVRIHVESVTGTLQDASNYRDPQAAYATWISETARHFEIPSDTMDVDPLIILDTCELLSEHDHHSLVHQLTGKPCTLLEAFCMAVPAPYGIFVSGCNATIDTTDTTYLAKANITNVGVLPPLSKNGYVKALTESWNAVVQPIAIDLVFHLTNGLPRLLRLALMKQYQNVSSITDGGANMRHCFEVYRDMASAQYPVQPMWFPQVYSCWLTSSTKAKVNHGSDAIVVNPAWRDPTRALTYDEATTQSIGALLPDSGRFTMPPITFGDAAIMKNDAPILPSQLHPFLDAEVVAHFGKYSISDRERLFDKSFLYAVYARYLLTYWENSDDPWVSLAKVFQGAVKPEHVPVLERYEVNLSSGVKTDNITDAVKNAITYTAGNAYIWCRDKAQEYGGVPAVPLLLRLCARPFGQGGAIKPPLILLVVHEECRDAHNDETQIVHVQADAMSSICWLYSPTSSDSS
ncbi:Bodo-specific multi-copy gene family, putative [Bodo saltans]|uniref:Bodo-specific multi-copy gene family, putative n=1 Tax=Bodo saltans TaxID=75058 RepID=A0A0S4JQU5_BODSA|nr:Bodo-specific multi-copy gene family, putative [Bodo saltans]|eukprot:CUG92569.1 Bodo-specific multi-copy gene family, putative [Bodo saltans]